MAAVELRDASKSFGGTKVIAGISLTVAPGEFVAFVGPSGSGKSTLLRMIAGLETVSGGSVHIDGKDVTGAEPAERGIAMVFQSYALYPHMNVYENIAFNLRLSRMDRTQIDARVREAAGILRLEGLLDRSPAQLSGGQRQRVAIGRAIVRHPKVFLFDEPLSNLDASLRVQMRLEIERLHRSLNATMIYVTHDQVEAMTLADRIVALEGGAIRQVGPPLELYARPANRFVAGFIGSPMMNFIAARVEYAGAATVLVPAISVAAQVTLPVPDVAAGSMVTLGIRPEAVAVMATGHAAPPGMLAWPARIETVERLGNMMFAYLDIGAADLITVQVFGDLPFGPGDAAQIGLSPDDLHVFNANGTALHHAAAKQPRT